MRSGRGLEISSKNAEFYAFLLRKSTCGHFAVHNMANSNKKPRAKESRDINTRLQDNNQYSVNAISIQFLTLKPLQFTGHTEICV